MWMSNTHVGPVVLFTIMSFSYRSVSFFASHSIRAGVVGHGWDGMMMWSLKLSLLHPDTDNGSILAAGLSTVSPPNVIHNVNACPTIIPVAAPCETHLHLLILNARQLLSAHIPSSYNMVLAWREWRHRVTDHWWRMWLTWMTR